MTPLVSTLKASNNSSTHCLLRYFDGKVPYRFLSPWFHAAKGDKKQIYSLSQSFLNDSLYAVNEQEVSINPKWIAYLSQNSGILKSFCYWHLSLYLQKHNPNVPDIPNKLIKPPQRNGLTKQRKDFWDLVIHHNGGSMTTSPSMAHHFDLYFDMQVLGLKTVLNNAHNNKESIQRLRSSFRQVRSL